MNRILIVEDEQHLAKGLQFNLEAEGYEVEIVPNGEMALTYLLEEKRQYEAVILDIMLPDKNGFEVASELRAAGQYVPILMLTARSRPEDVLSGFESGADDYLPKPFKIAILLARLKGLLRRRAWFNLQNQPSPASPASPAQPPQTPQSFVFCGKTLDFDSLELRVGGRIVKLTLMEADLLRYLINHESKPVSRKMILDQVWGLHEDTDTRAIDNFIVRLRRYIEDDPANPRHLITVRGVGYRFVATP